MSDKALIRAPIWWSIAAGQIGEKMRLLRSVNLILFEKELSFLVGAFLGTTWAFFVKTEWLRYLSHNAFALGDWLINYHTGWVRRGLSGEVILWVSRLLSVSPGLIVWLVWTITYGLFFVSVYLAWAAQKEKWPFLWIIFSPFLFTFLLQAGGFPRKEMLAFSLLFLLVALALYSSKQCFKPWAYGIFLVYPLILLSHEALILLLPYLVGVYLWKMGKVGMRWLFPIVLLSLGTFSTIVLLTMMRPVSGKQVAGIYHSIAAAGYSLKAKSFLDPISALGWDWTFTKQLWARKVLHGGMIKQCGIVIVLSMAAFLPVRARLKSILGIPVMRFLLFVGILGTIVLSMVAIDWGRFFRMQWVGLFAWTLLPAERPAFSVEKDYGIVPPLLVFFFTPVYATLWQVSFQCHLHPASLLLKSVVLLVFAFTGLHFVYTFYRAKSSLG